MSSLLAEALFLLFADGRKETLLPSANTKKRASASRKKREQKEDDSRLLEVKDVLATQSGKSFNISKFCSSARPSQLVIVVNFAAI